MLLKNASIEIIIMKYVIKNNITKGVEETIKSNPSKEVLINIRLQG